VAGVGDQPDAVCGVAAVRGELAEAGLHVRRKERVTGAFGRADGELVVAAGVRPVFDVDEQPCGQSGCLAENGEQPPGVGR
jgi:hypothetical protein